MKHIRYFDFTIFNDKLDLVFQNNFGHRENLILNTINPHSFVVAKKDNLFRNSLKKSNFLFADGIGIKIFSKIFLFKDINIINGPQIHDYLVSNFNSMDIKVMYLGSSEQTLRLIKKKHLNIGTQWQIQTYSPPFKEVFSEKENQDIIKSIRLFNPDILFVGMTAPKQEKWVISNIDQLNVDYVISIGAVFDFFSGNKKMAPEILKRIHFIWLYRLIFDFKRVWKRTFISMPKFIFYHIFPFLY